MSLVLSGLSIKRQVNYSSLLNNLYIKLSNCLYLGPFIYDTQLYKGVVLQK